MTKKQAIYDTRASNNISVNALIKIYQDHNVVHIYYKELSPNDNSKNQPYVAGHLTELGFLPTGEVTESTSTSNKTKDPKRKIKYTVALDFSWISSEGKLYSAPYAKLIYYPQYPEVRLSGFVSRCGFDMGGWMDPTKKGRKEGRVLFLGITKNGKILAYLAIPDSRLAKEIRDFPAVEVSGVFKELTIKPTKKGASSKELLVQELRRIHLKNWIESKRLNSDGTVKKYTAQNGGGYTLEAELGILPNGYADPDFMGWEVKQFGVKKCHLIDSKPLTLMTPEPDGGFYVENGVEAFVREYGHRNDVITDRFDFTGRHVAEQVCQTTGLMLVIDGYDKDVGKLTNASGNIALIDRKGNPAASWSFPKLMSHWKRKHAKAVYIPSLSMKDSNKIKSYYYCSNIRLFQGTTFERLLKGVIESEVYYDPGIKLEKAGTSLKTKRRSQFRIKSVHLKHLYETQEDVELVPSG